jgi:hypothetical protein
MVGNADFAVASVVFLGSIVFLVQTKLSYLAAWLVVVAIVMKYGARLPWTVSVGGAVATVAAVIYVSGETLKERYENASKDEKEEDKDEPKPHTEKDKNKHEHVGKAGKDEEAHLDAGTTILHAFQKLKPDQVLAMREDTKELMETQKQLVETLGALGPQVKQGAELIDSFSTMFSGVAGR